VKVEERITIKKASILKELVLAGLQAKGYTLIRETESRYALKIFHNQTVGSLAIYDTGPRLDDELVTVNLLKPEKVKILIREYRAKQLLGKDNKRFEEVADALEEILSGYQ
jgi:hypothetical protein